MPKPGIDWRAAIAAYDPGAARGPVTLHVAQLFLSKGLNAEAVEAYREFLDRFPNHAGAWNGLALLLRRLGRTEESADAIAVAARLEAGWSDDPAAIERFLAAADGSGDTPEKAPAAFVSKLFDDGADRFESLLKEGLSYRGPELLFDAVSRVLGAPPKGMDILDLGCGTGLAGEVFRSSARRLEGVDLSSKMLGQASAKKLYDSLHEGDVVEHLLRLNEPCDLILAADVFVYLGDLSPVFAAARNALRPGGLFAFTTEAMDSDNDGYQLQPIRRYAHSRGHLARAAGEAGLAIRLLEENSTRTQSTRPVRSWIAVMSA